MHFRLGRVPMEEAIAVFCRSVREGRTERGVPGFSINFLNFRCDFELYDYFLGDSSDYNRS